MGKIQGNFLSYMGKNNFVIFDFATVPFVIYEEKFP
jgi:hypothetical protein